MLENISVQATALSWAHLYIEKVVVYFDARQ